MPWFEMIRAPASTSTPCAEINAVPRIRRCRPARGWHCLQAGLAGDAAEAVVAGSAFAIGVGGHRAGRRPRPADRAGMP